MAETITFNMMVAHQISDHLKLGLPRNSGSSKQHQIALNLVSLLLIYIIFIQLLKVSRKIQSSESQLMDCNIRRGGN